MIAGILRESGNENRVALIPCETTVLKKLGMEVMVEFHAGERAFISDDEYKAAGATLADRKEIISRAALLLTVNPPAE